MLKYTYMKYINIYTSIVPCTGLINDYLHIGVSESLVVFFSPPEKMPILCP